MMTLLFMVLMVGVFGKLACFAFKAVWGIFKVVAALVFLPLSLVGLVIVGLIRIAFPILVFVGLATLVCRRIK